MQTIESTLLNRFVHVTCLFISFVCKIWKTEAYTVQLIVFVFLPDFSHLRFYVTIFVFVLNVQCNETTRISVQINECVLWAWILKWFEQNRTEQNREEKYGKFWMLNWKFNLIREWNCCTSIIITDWFSHDNKWSHRTSLIKQANCQCVEHCLNAHYFAGFTP